MQIQKTNNLNFTNGLYFSKASNVCFNKSADFINKEGVKLSKDGYKYIEQTKLSKDIKKRFADNKFIKNISEKFDTFVWFCKIPKDKVITGADNISIARIMWADTTKPSAQVRQVIGVSNKSLDDAQDKMFELLV